MRRRTWLSLIQLMASRMFGAKSLSEPILSYYQLSPREQTTVKFESNTKRFIHEDTLKNVICDMSVIFFSEVGWTRTDFNGFNWINSLNWFISKKCWQKSIWHRHDIVFHALIAQIGPLSFQAAIEHKPRQVRWGGLHAPLVTEWWPACLHKQSPRVHQRGS